MYTYVCMYVRVCVVCVCMFVCTYVCMYVFMIVCMYVCMIVCTEFKITNWTNGQILQQVFDHLQKYVYGQFI